MPTRSSDWSEAVSQELKDLDYLKLVKVKRAKLMSLAKEF